jgi:hypothetical protein
VAGGVNSHIQNHKEEPMLHKLVLAASAMAVVATASAPAFAGFRQTSLSAHYIDSSRFALIGRSRPGDWVTLNPQPLPPGGRVANGSFVSRPGGWVMLNPQPLPPRVFR